MAEELVSIVVPVYNVEEYLKHCVDTIVNQTYHNLEIFLVDDGSTDSSGLMCDELAEMDSRIKVIHKVNGGLSDARNVAIEIATGQYIAFIDSDDAIPPDAIEYLYQLVKKNDADIAIGNMLITSNKEEYATNTESFLKSFNNQEAVKEMFYGDFYSTSASGKLYKTSLFEGIRYPLKRVNEDLFTTYKVLDKSGKVVVSDKIVYYYYHRVGSIMNSSFSEKRLDVVRALDQIENDIDLPKYDAVGAFAGLSLSTLTTLMALKPAPEYVEEYRIWDRIKSYRIKVLKDERVNKRVKAYAALSFLGKRMMVIVYNLYYRMKWH